ncbi:hypothetical protein [Streptomyces cacaoi]|uniref:hypothetical protein n=1 Tax=Streptomyces cacaoi TaxID=1898 RepID=UPI003747CC01
MTTELPLKSLVVDTARGDKIGYVMGYVGPYVQLRPPGGGVEWDADPGMVRLAGETELIRARVSELNRAGRLG